MEKGEEAKTGFGVGVIREMLESLMLREKVRDRRMDNLEARLGEVRRRNKYASDRCTELYVKK